MKQLITNLKLSRKFMVIGAIATAMVALPTALLLKRQVDELASATRLLSGVDPARKLLSLVRLTQQHRGMSAVFLGGKPEMAGARSTKQAEVDGAVQALKLTIPGTQDSALIEIAQRVADDWGRLAADVQAGHIKGAESSARHTALIAAQLTLLEDITNSSGIVLTPERSAYFLQAGALLHLPQFTEVMGQMRARGALLLGQGSATPEEKERLQTLAELARTHFANASKSLKLAVADDPQLRKELEPAIASASEGSAQALDLVTERIVKASSLDLPSSEYFAQITRVIDEQFKLVNQTFDYLSASLHQQADQAKRSLFLVCTALAALAALGGWIMLVITRATTSSIDVALRAAQAVSAGDLSMPVATGGTDEVGQLLRSLEEMRRRLAQVVQAVRGNAESVSTASTQIAQGNLDLSSRTEQQASALQHTAASMEELGSTVRANADHAGSADDLARRTSSIAEDGGRLFDDVVVTMRKIDASSQRIADILETIDEIAFQTNILALNAAVEAARAGEQGRGFAVVASEVRSLAHRSAEAAKQIKSLIVDSRSEVVNGTALVDRASKSINGIVSSIGEVTSIVSAISAASREQSTGVSQVGEAVTQLDQMTQQNAALVEESAAAAESLQAQASQLVTAVAVFKLNAKSAC